jgi:hypothetical protein
MVGAHKARQHRWLILAAVSVSVLMVILYITDTLTAGTTALVTAGLCGLVVLAHALIDLANPNRNLQANRRRAQRRVQQGSLWVRSDRVAATARDASSAGSRSTGSPTVAYALLVLGLLAFVAPELLRLIHGWPVNKEWVPMVAGPGDEPYVYLNDNINSVKSYWRGAALTNRPTVAVNTWAFIAQMQGQQCMAAGPAPYLLGLAPSLNPVGRGMWFIPVANARELNLDPDRLRASSRTAQWGILDPHGQRVITMNPNEASKESPSILWLRVHLPDDPGLENKTLQLDLDMMVEYPRVVGTGWDDTTRKVPTEHKVLVLASAHAGSRYRLWWWCGLLAGTVLILIPGFMLMRLSRNLRQRAHPTSSFVSEESVAEKVSEPARPNQAMPEGQGEGASADPC